VVAQHDWACTPLSAITYASGPSIGVVTQSLTGRGNGVAPCGQVQLVQLAVLVVVSAAAMHTPRVAVSPLDTVVCWLVGRAAFKADKLSAAKPGS